MYTWEKALFTVVCFLLRIGNGRRLAEFFKRSASDEERFIVPEPLGKPCTIYPSICECCQQLEIVSELLNRRDPSGPN